MDGSFSDKLCEAIQKEKGTWNNQDQVYPFEKIKWSEYKVLCAGFRRIGWND